MMAARSMCLSGRREPLSARALPEIARYQNAAAADTVTAILQAATEPNVRLPIAKGPCDDRDSLDGCDCPDELDAPVDRCRWESRFAAAWKGSAGVTSKRRRKDKDRPQPMAGLTRGPDPTLLPRDCANRPLG
jgi:hypothetical protein